MRKGGGKNKGSAFERLFAKELSMWWTENSPNGVDPNVFWRTSGSGARHGIREEAGDIKSIKPIGTPLTDAVMFELKNWNESDLILDMLRADKRSKLYDAWAKCCSQAHGNNKTPFLVVKITNRTTICLFPSNMIDQQDVQMNMAIQIPSLGVSIMEYDAFMKTYNFIQVLREEQTKVL